MWPAQTAGSSTVDSAAPGGVKQHRVVRLTDLPVFGRPVVLAWQKVRRTCPNTDCPQGSWTTSDARIAAQICSVTQRAGRWLTEQVGRYRRAVSVVAAELGCDGHTVNDTMIAYGQLLVDDPDRIGPVTAIGMDETLFTRTGAYRTQRWATTFADVGVHRLIDIAPKAKIAKRLGISRTTVINAVEDDPVGRPGGGVIFHADRGCQYTSEQMAAVAAELDVRQSVGRTGVCWDNAQQESFWSTLKTEFHDRYSFTTRAEAIQAVSRWIDTVYNTRRRHSTLGQISPLQFETQYTTAAQEAA